MMFASFLVRDPSDCGSFSIFRELDAVHAHLLVLLQADSAILGEFLSELLNEFYIIISELVISREKILLACAFTMCSGYKEIFWKLKVGISLFKVFEEGVIINDWVRAAVAEG